MPNELLHVPVRIRARMPGDHFLGRDPDTSRARLMPRYVYNGNNEVIRDNSEHISMMICKGFAGRSLVQSNRTHGGIGITISHYYDITFVLRHYNFRLLFEDVPNGEADPESILALDSTFEVEPSRLDVDKLSFRSVNFDRYIRHHEFDFLIAPTNYRNNFGFLNTAEWIYQSDMTFSIERA